MRRSPRQLLPLAALTAAAVAGGALTLAGAAVFGGFASTTSTVRVLEPAPVGSTPTSFVKRGGGMTINQIYRRAAPGVVQVTSTSVVTAQDPFGFGTQQTEKALGSGFVIDKAGHIVTNYHVVQNSRSVQVSFSNHDSMRARIVGSDPSTDVAVLQVDAHSRALTPLELGNSDAVSVGDSVVAIGNPLGLERTVTAGIVSALQRAISAPNNFQIDHVIQTDAPINHGNSGGPLLDGGGRVIGVTSQIATGGTGEGNIGIGFAIPINTIRNVAAQLIKTGKAEHAYLGLFAKAIDSSTARLFRLPATHGLLVATVTPGSAAAAAGLRPGTNQIVVSGESYPLGGDLIVGADGNSVNSFGQLRDLISSKKPGDTLSLEIYRRTKKLTIQVKLGRQPSSPQR